LHRDNQTFDEIAKFDPPFNRGWDIIDTINGLFCFYRSGSIVLWNPSLKKSLILPKSRVLYHHSLGFGFVATSNEYKIVKISFASNKQLQAEVYRLSTGSWSDVKLEDSLNVVYKPVHLNGILHWSACNPGKFISVICSFDLKHEKFSSLMVPSCLRHGDNVSFYPSTFRESLSLIDKTDYGVCRIWVMKEYGVSDSWQNLIVISSQLLDLSSVCYFRHDGEILCEISGNPKLVSYDCKDKRVTNIELLADCLVTSVHTYVESLTLINISNVVPENIQGFSDLLLNERLRQRKEAKLNDECCKI
jgi:F-box interacting protein